MISLQEAGMSWLTEIEAMHTLTVLLNSVFVSGDAEPQTSVIVMTICSALLFTVLGLPKLKRRQRLAARVNTLDKVDLRRLSGT